MSGNDSLVRSKFGELIGKDTENSRKDRAEFLDYRNAMRHVIEMFVTKAWMVITYLISCFISEMQTL